jgi:hypothetical protein
MGKFISLTWALGGEMLMNKVMNHMPSDVIFCFVEEEVSWRSIIDDVLWIEFRAEVVTCSVSSSTSEEKLLRHLGSISISKLQ